MSEPGDIRLGRLATPGHEPVRVAAQALDRAIPGGAVGTRVGFEGRDLTAQLVHGSAEPLRVLLREFGRLSRDGATEKAECQAESAQDAEQMPPLQIETGRYKSTPARTHPARWVRTHPPICPLRPVRRGYKDIFMSNHRHQEAGSVPFPQALAVLRAAAEETRLRILALLAEGELSVSDLTDILGQSQPRISRHLKLLVEAGLVERHREGAWAFFRLAENRASLADPLVAGLDRSAPPLSEDRARLDAVRAQRAEAAQSFFARLAPKWDELRSLHVPEAIVEAAVLEALGPRPIGSLLDLGTGTGRMLGLLAPLAGKAVGLDSSHAMLSVARANFERLGIARVELRQGDIHAPPFARASFDLVIVHQVLHYLDDPARALKAAARLVAPGGRLLVVDFAPHELEFLRTAQAHRRLGFSTEQIAGWLAEAGLPDVTARNLTPTASDQLTVTLWLGAEEGQGADAAAGPDWAASLPDGRAVA